MAIIGYARVSTEDQTTENQVAPLSAAGCREIFTEHASGADRRRPELAKALKALQPGDTLMVVRIDRLARSASHLLEIIEGLELRGIAFKSLSDPIDTRSSHGRFVLQMLAAVAELERSIIRERTIAGLAIARKNGRIGGNPKLRDRDPETIAKVNAAREALRDEVLLTVADDILPFIEKMRPQHPWEDVAIALAQAGLKRPDGKPWDGPAIARAARRLAKNGMLLEPDIFDRATETDRPNNHVLLVAMVAKTMENPTLLDIARKMEILKCKTPRGSATWSLSSVQNALQQAIAHGLLENRPMPPEGTPRGRGRPLKHWRPQTAE